MTIEERKTIHNTIAKAAEASTNLNNCIVYCTAVLRRLKAAKKELDSSTESLAATLKTSDTEAKQ